MFFSANLVPRITHLTAPGGGKMSDPGNEVGFLQYSNEPNKLWRKAVSRI